MAILYECPKCKARIKYSKLLKHLRTVHQDVRLPDMHQFVQSHEFKLFRPLDTSDNITVRTKSFLQRSKVNSGQYGMRIDFLDKQIDKIMRARFFEESAAQFKELKSQIESGYYELDGYHHNKYLQILRTHQRNMLRKAEYIKEKCTMTYITWDDISFTSNCIRISANKAFVKPIQVVGSMKILDEIKVDYFKRKYKDHIYKLVIYQGEVQEDLTKDLTIIREIVQQHTEKNNKSPRPKKTVTHREVVYDKRTIHQAIKRMASKNEFLRIPALLLNENDKVVATVEINNQEPEECLIFIFDKKSQCAVLWENINSNRAGYLFTFPQRAKKNNLPIIKSIIKSEEDNKRELLFRGADLKTVYSLRNCEYYCLVHENEGQYHVKLKSILEHLE